MYRLRGKVALIAPNSYVANLALKVSKGFGDIVEIYEGNLEEGVKAAKRALTKGCKVIISRGGTALMIEEELDVTVVPISFTSNDLIKTISKIKLDDNVIGIIGYKNLIEGITEIENLLDYRIYFSEIRHHKEIEEKILELYKRFGVENFIGGEAVVKIAEDLGLKGFLMECGAGAIKRAISEGIRIAKIIVELNEERMQLRAIAEHSSDGIILLDEMDKIKYINPSAQRVLMINYEDMLGENVLNYISSQKIIDAVKKKEQVIAEYDQIKNTKVIFNYVPLMENNNKIGSIISFNDISKIEELERKIRKEQYTRGFVAKYTFNDIIATSERMKNIIEMAKRISKNDTTILITGESGTGKELMAQSIHNESLRKHGPFIAVNCASLPKNLLESELFGYAEGAFTGAKKGGKPGLFELAHMGTIFLDEIADMPLDLQAHLLRVIQEKEVSRIGDDKVIPIDVRVIAATNKDLRKYVSEGKFREDLYYRLNVINIKIPPLRERKEDIPLLIKYFLSIYASKNKMVPKKVNEEAIKILKNYSWPGNIRELQNFIERLMLTVEKNIIDEKDVCEILDIDKECIYDPSSGAMEKYLESGINNIGEKMNKGILNRMEKEYILKILKEVNGNRKKAAEILGISTTTLWRRLKELNINY
ncbi:sigma-54-dependent Fis family transcriptional regulator [Thermovenabulum gondwanense]|uniref:Limonene hydroxylase n=1 Tax=Thermovenabulum gondwanense TaxID=520767 RepID=A0A162N303_9FIRM|nr:sigma-54-dependent Fis family transcriptional regulator [Thermovenabulum gondwanense]KYO68722.1 Limonene hydroxylase [Thermovenabulum gondwanense]